MRSGVRDQGRRRWRVTTRRDCARGSGRQSANVCGRRACGAAAGSMCRSPPPSPVQRRLDVPPSNRAPGCGRGIPKAGDAQTDSSVDEPPVAVARHHLSASLSRSQGPKPSGAGQRLAVRVLDLVDAVGPTRYQLPVFHARAGGHECYRGSGRTSQQQPRNRDAAPQPDRELRSWHRTCAGRLWPRLRRLDR